MVRLLTLRELCADVVIRTHGPRDIAMLPDIVRMELMPRFISKRIVPDLVHGDTVALVVARGGSVGVVEMTVSAVVPGTMLRGRIHSRWDPKGEGAMGRYERSTLEVRAPVSFDPKGPRPAHEVGFEFVPGRGSLVVPEFSHRIVDVPLGDIIALRWVSPARLRVVVCDGEAKAKGSRSAVRVQSTRSVDGTRNDDVAHMTNASLGPCQSPQGAAAARSFDEALPRGIVRHLATLCPWRDVDVRVAHGRLAAPVYHLAEQALVTQCRAIAAEQSVRWRRHGPSKSDGEVLVPRGPHRSSAVLTLHLPDPAAPSPPDTGDEDQAHDVSNPHSRVFFLASRFFPRLVEAVADALAESMMKTATFEWCDPDNPRAPTFRRTPLMIST